MNLSQIDDYRSQKDEKMRNGYVSDAERAYLKDRAEHNRDAPTDNPANNLGQFARINKDVEDKDRKEYEDWYNKSHNIPSDEGNS
jgi:hypothetical protein